jgi:4-alpha-glucanotransferase
MAAGKISLVLGSHAHVPYGAETSEFEKVYAGLLRPFVSGLYKHPQIQAALHYSGVLLHWVERSHPELLMLIEDMVARKQVEMLGGGFYEPMLPIIPLQDKIGQIELLTTYLRKQFGKRPQGCWIPAFAWEQGLVSPLAACGMGFTFLGEQQFVLAGGNGRVPCICEDQGKLITVFPVLQPPEAALTGEGISALLSGLLENRGKRHSKETELVVALFPLKAGAGKNESTENAWGRFFEELSRCESYAETVIPGRLVKNLNGLQKLYIPDSSDAADGMPPRRFIITHPEADRIHAKMVFTNVLINQLRGDKSRKLSAHEELWKAQGDALFRSVGAQGLHSHLLRNAAYSALLGAERVSREKSKFVSSLVPFDFNMDGSQEWLFQDTKINCYVQSTGGGIFELDYLPKVWNYLDTCSGRFAFADRLLPSAFKVENLKYGAIDGARLCSGESYEPVELDKVRRKLRLVLHQMPSISLGNIEIEKTYSLKKDSVCSGYIFTNRGTEKETFQFAPEIDLALPGEGDAFTRFFACKSTQADTALVQPILSAVDGLKIHDIKNEVQINLTVNRPFDGKISPVYIPDDITGAELYQAFCIMPLFPVSLEPGGKWELEFTLRFSH